MKAYLSLAFFVFMAMNPTFVIIRIVNNNYLYAAPGDDKYPTDLRCLCEDGTLYSYGNNCGSGTQKCIATACPPPPDPCGR